MKSAYEAITIGGGDTDKPITMEKRLKIIGRHIHNPSLGNRFLDCGCGAGGYVQVLLDRFKLDAHGVEYDSRKVEKARLNPELKDRIRQGDLEALEFSSDSWDYALLNEVLEHIPDDHKALKEIYRILKPGGYLFVFSPNRCFPIETHGINLRHSNRRLPFFTPFIPYIPVGWGRLFLRYNARNYWPGELARLVEASQFSIVDQAFIATTFENISGAQPSWITACRPFLRKLAQAMESIPGLRCFGVSQALVCRK